MVAIKYERGVNIDSAKVGQQLAPALLWPKLGSSSSLLDEFYQVGEVEPLAIDSGCIKKSS